MDKYQQQVSVGFSYPVIFTRDVFDRSNEVLPQTLGRTDERGPHRTLFFIDAGLAAAHPRLVDDIQAYAEGFSRVFELVLPPRVVPGGESVKNNYRLAMEILDTILEARLCRQSFVVAMGGGAVLDAVGFAASLVHRGVRLIRMPSTVLAQNDAGVGVKNGMNLHGGKNTIGTFAPPFAVLNDFTLLSTLTDTDWRGGIAEAFKVAIIKDSTFFDFLCEHAEALRSRDMPAMETLIRRCATLHLDHIRDGGDPFEFGRARPLDFGHWAAHKLESMTSYALSHGEAVAMGVALDTHYAARQGWLTDDEAHAIFAGLARCGLPLWHDALGRRLGDGTLEVLGGIEEFREHLGGRLTVTFPAGIGARHEVHEIDRDLVDKGVRFLRGLAPGVTTGS